MSSAPDRPQRYFLRFDIHQRLQHAIIMVAFIILVVTGLPLRYAGSPAAYTITQAVGGAYRAAIIHRGAATLLILGSVYHVVYLVVLAVKGTRRTRMIPVWKDITDFVRALLYNLDLVKTGPRYDRYTFAEKFEYWSMVWGTIIMVITGLLLWDPVQTAQVLPVVTLKLARVIHSYEALLAFLAIIIWHFYHVHLRPGMFPMSTSWITGLVSEEEMKEHHPLEYERIMARRQGDETTESSGDEDTPTRGQGDGGMRGL